MSLSAAAILNSVRGCGITHLVGLPDTESNAMFAAVESAENIQLVPVCREGESFGVVLGLLAGGVNAAVMIQSTGLYESGDSVRAIAVKQKLPLLMLIGYRGFVEDRNFKDTAAVYLEPILDAWRIPHYLISDDTDLHQFRTAYADAVDNSRAVAILIGAEYVN